MTSLHPTSVRLSVASPELATALDSVRFAAGNHAELPTPSGILFDCEEDVLHLVATDRYRMAVAPACTTGHDGPRTRVVVPLPLADAMRALLTGAEPVRLAVDGDRVTLESGDRRTSGRSLGSEFPDYRRLVHLPAGRRAHVDTVAFPKTLLTGPVRASKTREQNGGHHDLSVLRVAESGTVVVCKDGDDDQDNVAVNREFLLQALAAGDRNDLILEVGTPTAPIAIRRPDDEGAFSLLMPVRLDDQGVCRECASGAVRFSVNRTRTSVR